MLKFQISRKFNYDISNENKDCYLKSPNFILRHITRNKEQEGESQFMSATVPSKQINRAL